MLAALRILWNLPLDAIAALASDPHGPGSLTQPMTQRLAGPAETAAAPWIAGDYPQWLDASLARAFGEERGDQASWLAKRAPVDVRVNTLKASRAKVLRALEKLGAIEGPLSPDCIRLPLPAPDGRNPNVEAEPGHGKGWFEIQDAGSQAAALLSGAKPGEQVADICAGSGGKTLALAAMMQNRGQIHAHDEDKHRLRPIFERIARAGARNIQVISSVFGRVLAALDHAHARGVVHRDLKPANVLLAAEGAVVADFGIARMADALAAGRTQLTETAAVLGTVAYMSPEQRAGGALDHRSDLFSLGVMLYEALTGTLPQGAFSPPSALRSGLGGRLDTVVLRLLRPQPADRFASAADAGRALDGAAVPGALVPAAGAGSGRCQRRRGRVGWRVVGVARSGAGAGRQGGGGRPWSEAPPSLINPAAADAREPAPARTGPASGVDDSALRDAGVAAARRPRT